MVTKARSDQELLGRRRDIRSCDSGGGGWGSGSGCVIARAMAVLMLLPVLLLLLPTSSGQAAVVWGRGEEGKKIS